MTRTRESCTFFVEWQIPCTTRQTVVCLWTSSLLLQGVVLTTDQKTGDVIRKLFDAGSVRPQRKTWDFRTQTSQRNSHNDVKRFERLSNDQPESKFFRLIREKQIEEPFAYDEERTEHLIDVSQPKEFGTTIKSTRDKNTNPSPKAFFKTSVHRGPVVYPVPTSASVITMLSSLSQDMDLPPLQPQTFPAEQHPVSHLTDDSILQKPLTILPHRPVISTNDAPDLHVPAPDTYHSTRKFTKPPPGSFSTSSALPNRPEIQLSTTEPVLIKEPISPPLETEESPSEKSLTTTISPEEPFKQSNASKPLAKPSLPPSKRSSTPAFPTPPANLPSPESLTSNQLFTKITTYATKSPTRGEKKESSEAYTGPTPPARDSMKSPISGNVHHSSVFTTDKTDRHDKHEPDPNLSERSKKKLLNTGAVALTICFAALTIVLAVLVAILFKIAIAQGNLKPKTKRNKMSTRSMSSRSSLKI